MSPFGKKNNDETDDAPAPGARYRAKITATLKTTVEKELNNAASEGWSLVEAVPAGDTGTLLIFERNA